MKSFKLYMKESGVKDAVIIADKGFYSENNVKLLNGKVLKFIVPLKLDGLRIDYSKVKKADKQIFDNYFKFEDRFIWYYTLQSGQFNTIVYLDQERKIKEEGDFSDRIETGLKKVIIEKFHQKQNTFGTNSLQNNLRKTPKKSMRIIKAETKQN